MNLLDYRRVTSILIGILFYFSMVMAEDITINEKGYFEKRGLNVMVLNDIYPEGHQGGIAIIQHGRRVTNNGNLSLQPTPGQWQPYPKLLDKKVDKDNNVIRSTLMFPDSNRIKTHEQPVIYPDLEFKYDIITKTDGESIKIIVDLEKPLPKEWIGKVGFNMELYPEFLFGKSYVLDNTNGIFPRYANTPVYKDSDGEYEALPMAEGNKLIVAPDDPMLKMTFQSKNAPLKLIDGRVKHNNGWFVVRSLIPAGATKNAIVWTINVNTVEDWHYGPVVHVSQVGYHPLQEKVAVIEIDKNNSLGETASLININTGETIDIQTEKSDDFLRYKYLTADFSDIIKDGIYYLQYEDKKSNIFRISKDIYKQGVWQPTLEYYLPIQMCHMKVFEKYRVWHDVCHLDDALMAPENINHFDVYTHGKVPEGYEPLQPINGLKKGGWHDAGDYDFRIESLINTIIALSYAYEEFDVNHDQTLVDQEDRIVEIHHPDGKPDVLQQIEHGLLSVLAGYREFGKLYRGILCPTLRQYAMLGDAGSMTDNEVFTGEVKGEYEGFWYEKVHNKYEKYYTPQYNRPVKKEYVEKLDDRMVFLEDNPGRQLNGAAGLAVASRVLKDYDKKLSKECIDAAIDLYNDHKNIDNKHLESAKIYALIEIYLTTDSKKYKKELLSKLPEIKKSIGRIGWALGRVLPKIKNEEFVSTINHEIKQVKNYVDKASRENPFGIPYHPSIWGAGWGIQTFGYHHYFLHTGWPEIFDKEPMLRALNFVLGVHPGENTASFASNVGTVSQTVAYGINRADWSFIPGGVVSGTNIVRPDLPEMKNWPYLWQQTEYCMGGGATHFMFLVLAADKILE
ncbi:MAG: glycoside hydrolase family 9 protein [Fidelibacterota bacterium]